MSRPTLLNLRELELAQQAYEVAWAKIVRREPKRNTTKDDERKELLRSRLFAACAVTKIMQRLFAIGY
jgi:hypothetical protein